MLRAHSVADVRSAERRLMAQLPPGTLMQRAAAGLAVACAARLPRVYGSRVVLLVGRGDNGADALWAGSRLAKRGADVVAVLTGDPRPDALAAFRGRGGRVGTDDDLARADLVVDGLVGIGGSGALRPRAAELAELARGHDVVAVDLPSGIDADTGAVPGSAVVADLTVTFGTCKPGLLVGAGARHAGKIELVDIGLGPYLPQQSVEQLTDLDAALLLPRPGEDSDKYSRGVVGVTAGSEQYTGAAVLCVGAAVRAGAGMIRYAGARHAAEQVRARWPEVVVTEATGGDVFDAGRVQSWVVGPGLGTDDVAAQTVEAVLAHDVPVLVDADALTLCAQRPEWLRNRRAPTLLTPHDREFARFDLAGREQEGLAELGDDRLAAARRLAADLGVTVLLKGNTTVVADADGRTRVNSTGTPALATAGTGDVLAGGVGALLAAGLTPLDAGSLGAHLHGLAGQLASGQAPTSASAVLDAWPSAVRTVLAARLGP